MYTAEFAMADLTEILELGLLEFVDLKRDADRENTSSSVPGDDEARTEETDDSPDWLRS